MVSYITVLNPDVSCMRVYLRYYLHFSDEEPELNEGKLFAHSHTAISDQTGTNVWFPDIGSYALFCTQLMIKYV